MSRYSEKATKIYPIFHFFFDITSYKKLALDLGIQTYQILTSDDEVCIPCLVFS